MIIEYQKKKLDSFLKFVFQPQTMDNLQNIGHVFLKYATVRIL